MFRITLPDMAMMARQELQDAVSAGGRPSAFQQGVQAFPSQQQSQQNQQAMMPPMGGFAPYGGFPPLMGGMMPPAMPQMPMQQPMAQMAPQPMMPQQQPMAQPPMPTQQFAKGGLAVWDKPAPKGKSKPLSAKQKTAAKRRAKAAGRPYPNLVGNLAVRK